MAEEKPNNPGNDKERPKLPKISPYWIYGLVAVVLIIVSTMYGEEPPRTLSYGQFEKKILGSAAVEKIVWCATS